MQNVEHETDRDFVLKTARDQNVRFVRLWFTDILGFLKSVAIPVSELADALEHGVGFDEAETAFMKACRDKIEAGARPERRSRRSRTNDAPSTRDND